jgi:hypothetical protein
MGEIRSLYGDECTVVHSYKTRSSYRIIVAVDGSVQPDRKDEEQNPREQNYQDNEDISWSSPAFQVSEKLLELAARVKALEELSFPLEHIGPERPEIKQILFSEILSDKSTQSCKPDSITATLKSETLEPQHKLVDHEILNQLPEKLQNDRNDERSVDFKVTKSANSHQTVSASARRFTEIVDKTVFIATKSRLA